MSLLSDLLPRLQLSVHAEPGAELTLLFLPPAAASADDFVRHGFISALTQQQVMCNYLQAELPPDLYANGTFLPLLEQALLTQTPGQRLWLVGISLGAMTALACAARGHLKLEGVVALAPWPGPRDAWRDLVTCGELKPQAPSTFDQTSIEETHVERRVWHWLAQTTVQTTAQNIRPKVFMAHGERDRFAEGQRCLARYLPPNQVITDDSAHDWDGFCALWQQFLKHHAQLWR